MSVTAANFLRIAELYPKTMEDLKIRALERRKFFQNSYEKAIQAREKVGFQRKISKTYYPDDTHRSQCNYSMSNINRDELLFDFVEYDQKELKAMQVFDSILDASDNLSARIQMLQNSVSQTLTDINDGVVILKRVSDPKNGMSPSLGNKRALTPISRTSDSSEEEMNMIGETPR